MKTSSPTHEQISQRAYQIFIRNGSRHGRAMEHWLEAEAELGQQDTASAKEAPAAGNGSKKPVSAEKPVAAQKASIAEKPVSAEKVATGQKPASAVKQAGAAKAAAAPTTDATSKTKTAAKKPGKSAR